MTIGELINRDKVVLNEDDTVEKAIELILRHCRTGMPVLNDKGEVTGFLSEEDIIKKCLPGYMTTLKNPAFLPDCGQVAKRFSAVRFKKVAEIMQKNVITFREDEKDFAVAAEMIRRHLKVCPVTDKKGKFSGCISRAYLIRAMMLAENQDEKTALKYE